MNSDMADKGYAPVYTAGAGAKIVIVGQAPGAKAQMSMKPWNDASGRLLRQWLGVSEEQFYDPNLIALIPMDFFFPGKGVHGDLPPRKGFAEKWHPRLLEHMPNVELILLVGAYAQKYYLGSTTKYNLTETVRAFDEYLPRYFPLVHPSPLNFRWRAKNAWFDSEVVPKLHERVWAILEK
ncbi:uracil-DNA glycosylase family protein [Candidatus Saccharibacteria bacterium TM7i]|nr:uracil-DNA glycosylase family protein [Candidatus Saccharibacteria bacterium TM7i]